MFSDDNPDDESLGPATADAEAEMLDLPVSGPLGKKRRNGFFAFLNEHGTTLRAMHPNMKGHRFRVRMGQIWQRLSSEEKLKYVNQTGHRPLPVSSLSQKVKSTLLARPPAPLLQRPQQMPKPSVSDLMQVDTEKSDVVMRPRLPSPPTMPKAPESLPVPATDDQMEPQWRPPTKARKTTVVPYVRPLNKDELKKCKDYANVPCRILPKPLTAPLQTPTQAKLPTPTKTQLQTKTPLQTNAQLQTKMLLQTKPQLPTSVPPQRPQVNWVTAAAQKLLAAPSSTKSDVKLILVQSSDPLLQKPVGTKSGEDGNKAIGGKGLSIPTALNVPKPSISVSPGVGKTQGCFTKLTSSSTSITIAPAGAPGATTGTSPSKRRMLTAEESESLNQCVGQKRLIDRKMLDLIRTKAGGGDIRKVIFTNGGRDVISIMALPPPTGGTIHHQKPSPKKDPSGKSPLQVHHPQKRVDDRDDPPRHNGARPLPNVGARRFLGGDSDAGSSMVDVLIVDSGKQLKILRSQMPVQMKDELNGRLAAQSGYVAAKDPVEESDEEDCDALAGNVTQRIETIRVNGEEAGISRDHQKPETVLKVRKATNQLQARLLRALRYNGKLDWKSLSVSKMYVEEAVLMDLKNAKESATNVQRHSSRKVLMGVQVMRLKPTTDNEGHVYVVFRGTCKSSCLTAPEEVSIRIVPPAATGSRTPPGET